MLKKVIWATDGSPTTKSEYPVAKDLAESSGAKLIVAHAGEMVSSSEAGIFVDSTDTLQATLERTVDDLKREGLDAELALVKASHANAAQRMAEFVWDWCRHSRGWQPRLRAGRCLLPWQLHLPLAPSRALPGRRRSYWRATRRVISPDEFGI